RPHRRSQCRLEGARAVDVERRSRAVADRRRQGHETHGRALPASPGSAGEVNAAALTTIAGAAPRPPLLPLCPTRRALGVLPLPACSRTRVYPSSATIIDWPKSDLSDFG